MTRRPKKTPFLSPQSTCPTRTAGPSCPGVGLLSYQPTGYAPGGSSMEPSGFRPRSMTEEVTPRTGIDTRTGLLAGSAGMSGHASASGKATGFTVGGEMPVAGAGAGASTVARGTSMRTGSLRCCWCCCGARTMAVMPASVRRTDAAASARAARGRCCRPGRSTGFTAFWAGVDGGPVPVSSTGRRQAAGRPGVAPGGVGRATTGCDQDDAADDVGDPAAAVLGRAAVTGAHTTRGLDHHLAARRGRGGRGRGGGRRCRVGRGGGRGGGRVGRRGRGRGGARGGGSGPRRRCGRCRGGRGCRGGGRGRRRGCLILGHAVEGLARDAVVVGVEVVGIARVLVEVVLGGLLRRKVGAVLVVLGVSNTRKTEAQRRGEEDARSRVRVTTH